MNAVGTYIACNAGLGVYLHDDRTHVAASTSGFMNHVISLCLVSAFFMSFKDPLNGKNC